MRIDTLDLHGLILSDAMTRFVGRYNALVNDRQSELRALQVIHGKGMAGSESVIREELRDFLRKHGKRIKGFDAGLGLRGADYLLDNCGRLAYMHGEDVDRNGGQTFVVPFERLSLPLEWRKY